MKTTRPAEDVCIKAAGEFSSISCDSQENPSVVTQQPTSLDCQMGACTVELQRIQTKMQKVCVCV